MTRIATWTLRCLALALVLAVPTLPAHAQQSEAERHAHVLPDRVPHAAPDPRDTAPTPEPDLPVWQRTLYKTLTYQAAANVADVMVFDLLVGATAAVNTGFFVANAASAAVAYYGFEYAWQNLGPGLDEAAEQNLAEKLILFRFIGVGRNFALGYVFGGGPVTGAAYAAANVIYDTAIFTTNEYVWDVMRPDRAP